MKVIVMQSMNYVRLVELDYKKGGITMANSYVTNPIVLDTFTSAIDVASSAGWGTAPIYVKSIEWQTPTSTAHTALITDAASGGIIFSEQCTTVNQSIIKYYNTWVRNLYIALGGVGSGAIVITL